MDVVVIFPMYAANSFSPASFIQLFLVPSELQQQVGTTSPELLLLPRVRGDEGDETRDSGGSRMQTACLGTTAAELELL